MWRFLLAGVGTIGGMVLLFFASFGDPAPTVRDLASSRAVATVPARPVDMASNAIPAEQGGTAQSTATTPDAMKSPAVSPQPPAPIVTPPVYHGPVSYALPWRTSPAPVRHVHAGGPTPGPVRFFAAVRHDLRALFRVASR
ncbi:MAG TPA: hypothetical protein VNW90_21015 [Acetobacteraceae bacterium]|jgi:hypothetical protein|nr:hypothetical protein [Acetobacteraceae bacterium]